MDDEASGRDAGGRDTSGELAFGDSWLGRHDERPWRLWWARRTGALCAAPVERGASTAGAHTGDAVGDAVEVLAALPTQAAVEAALAGWSRLGGIPGSLEWARARAAEAARHASGSRVPPAARSADPRGRGSVLGGLVPADHPTGDGGGSAGSAWLLLIVAGGTVHWRAEGDMRVVVTGCDAMLGGSPPSVPATASTLSAAPGGDGR